MQPDFKKRRQEMDSGDHENSNKFYKQKVYLNLDQKMLTRILFDCFSHKIHSDISLI